MYRNKNYHWKYLAAVLLSAVMLIAGCGSKDPAPAAEQASEDMSQTAQTADT